MLKQMIIALSFVSATVAANAQTEAKAITMEQTAPIATYGKGLSLIHI
jgi:hypothetical protein